MFEGNYGVPCTVPVAPLAAGTSGNGGNGMFGGDGGRLSSSHSSLDGEEVDTAVSAAEMAVEPKAER